MFVDEARLASRIEHANVAEILDVGEQHDVTYLVMEYIDGEALSRLHRAAQEEGGIDPAGIVLRVMADVCGGLHAAHELAGHGRTAPRRRAPRRLAPERAREHQGRGRSSSTSASRRRGPHRGRHQHRGPSRARCGTWRPSRRWARASIAAPTCGPWARSSTTCSAASRRSRPRTRCRRSSLSRAAARRLPLPRTCTRRRPPSCAGAVGRPGARYATALEMQQALEDAMREGRPSTTSATIAAYLAERTGTAARSARRPSRSASRPPRTARSTPMMRSNARRQTGTSSSGTGTPSLAPSEATNPARRARSARAPWTAGPWARPR